MCTYIHTEFGFSGERGRDRIEFGLLGKSVSLVWCWYC